MISYPLVWVPSNHFTHALLGSEVKENRKIIQANFWRNIFNLLDRYLLSRIDDLESGLVDLLPLKVNAVDRPVQDQLTVHADSK